MDTSATTDPSDTTGPPASPWGVVKNMKEACTRMNTYVLFVSAIFQLNFHENTNDRYPARSCAPRRVRAQCVRDVNPVQVPALLQVLRRYSHLLQHGTQPALAWDDVEYSKNTMKTTINTYEIVNKLIL